MISRFHSCAKKWTLSAATGMLFLSSGAAFGQAPPTSAAPYTPQGTLQNAVQRELNNLNSAEPQAPTPSDQQQAQPAKKRFSLFGGSSSGSSNKRVGLRHSRTRPGSRRLTSRTPQITPARPQITPARPQSSQPQPVQQIQYAPAAPQRRVSPQQNSAVIAELHKLYRADGRPVPQMNVPNYQRPAIDQTAAEQARSQKKPGLMSKIFPFMKKKEKAVPQRAPQQVAPAPIQPQNALGGIPPAPAPVPIEAEPIQPLQEIPSISELAPAPLPSDDLDNLFSEESEIEADRSEANPFGELAIEEEAATVEPAKAEQPTRAPNPFEPIAEDEEELVPAKILPAGPAAEPALEEAKREKHAEKIRQIADRKGRNGLKGFCVVSLRDKRELIDTASEFASIHGLKTYYFSTAEAKAKFDAEPEKYAPASDGHDVVVLTNASEEVEGTLDHAAWYRGKLYLFSSADSKAKFHEAPADYLQQSPIEQVKLEQLDEEEPETAEEEESSVRE